MPNIKFTNKAVLDLTKIWEYTKSKWSEKQAEKYYRLIINSCNQISDKPEIGKDYPEILPNLKGLKTAKHIIFYRSNQNNDIEIIRILHEKMDLKSKL